MQNKMQVEIQKLRIFKVKLFFNSQVKKGVITDNLKFWSLLNMIFSS